MKEKTLTSGLLLLSISVGPSALNMASLQQAAGLNSSNLPGGEHPP